MLEWLKTILGENYSEDIDKKVSAEIGKGFVSKVDFNTLNETKKGLESTVAERDGQLEKLKAVDADGLQAEITRLQGENAEAKTKYDEDLKTTKLNYALEAELSKAGAVNTKAVKALLDSSKISLDGDNLLGVTEQLKALKESEKWAFTSSETKVPGEGGNPPPTPNTKAPLPKGTVIF